MRIPLGTLLSAEGQSAARDLLLAFLVGPEIHHPRFLSIVSAVPAGTGLLK
jgi:hypothetical protein